MKRFAVCSLLVLIVVLFLIPTAALADNDVENIAVIEKDTQLSAPVITVCCNDELSGKPCLAWKTVACADSYVVYRATSANGTYTKMFTTANTHYTNTAAEAGRTYYYKVMAQSAGSEYSDSPFSDIYCRSCDCGKPIIVSCCNNELSGKPYLAWKAVDGADRYIVYRATSADGKFTKLYTTSNTCYTNTTAEAGETYYYKIVAHSDNGDFADSVFSDVYCRSCDCGKPIIVSCCNNELNGKPYLAWKAVDGADRYIVYRAVGADGVFTKQYTTSSTAYTNTTAAVGQTYYYKIIAHSDNGDYADSVFSDKYCRTCDCAMPVLTAEYNTVTKHPELSWNAVDGADRYIIYRSSKIDGTYNKMFTTMNTHYINTYSEVGNTYYYKVVAVSDISSYADSASDNVKMVACGEIKIYLSPSDQIGNLYAYGNTTEAIQCRRIANALEALLKRCGFAVINNQTYSMQGRVNESNEWGADLHIPIHTNASGVNVSGTRIFTEDLKGEDYKCAQCIFNCLAPVTPGRSENISPAPDFYEINHSNATTVYIECEFHDVSSTAKWIIEHVEDIAAAICRGICDYYNVEMCTY